MDVMDRNSGPGLSKFYDDLKRRLNEPAPTTNAPMTYSQVVDTDRCRHLMLKERDKLRDGCYKHLLLDIYCKILPLDKDYIDGHMGVMKGDVDSLLKSKGMTPTQYLTSCYESTGNPTIDYLIRSVNMIGTQFMEEAMDQIKDNKEKGIDAPLPAAPEDPTEDENVNDQLIDVKKDDAYENFIAELEDKTIKKIVADVSKIISDKKKDQNMAFDPKPVADVAETTESTTSVGMNYLMYKLYQEHIDTSGMTEDLLGLAIRESTLNQFNLVFNHPGGTFREFVSRIQYNHGVLINESAVATIIEACKSAAEVNGVVDQAKKDFNKTIDSKLKASDVIGAEDDKKNEKKDGNNSPLGRSQQ